MSTISTHTLRVPRATLTYDVHGALPTGGRPPLLMIGQPMGAEGFGTLAAHFPERTVVTYDPRGLGRSTREDGRLDNDPVVQAEDLHHLIDTLGSGPVEMFASSGGAVTGLALVAAHPEDVSALVAHEPPLLAVLPDAERAFAAEQAVQETYHANGAGAGMAQFIAMTMWRGEFTDRYAAQPAPDPASFGIPVDDDGSRGDPLLSGVSNAVTRYQPDVRALTSAPTHIVIAAGVQSADTITGRTAAALAVALGQPLTIFPSHHGGFLGGEYGQAGEPEAFAARLHEVLDTA
ncbi:Pimeloyl-ACP methyl ester carboxylesterase [Raineyella antarctica]|uniref:Pimeloyl-ACP methyl ester carboxylesterase n=1 Tax=Raineyella antarctica TaxID=1577474 RepID=A0A1G6I761_9ACTN|nr:alpha/beta hydrolase [Raineyella antarctica]SDC01596.1 Pimeloyl-ACP methyl ester carboxylesterase [Raineyella antarctica]